MLNLTIFNLPKISRKRRSKSDDENIEWNTQAKQEVKDSQLFIILNKIKKGTQEDEVLQELIKSLTEGANINAKNKQGNTLLHIAVNKNYNKVIRFLLAKGAHINIHNNQNYTVLDFARGNQDIEQILMQSINVPKDGNCLFWAIALAYLTPVMDEQELFRERFIKLFGDYDITVIDNIQVLIKGYNPFKNTDNDILHDTQFFSMVAEKFRTRVVKYIQTHQDILGLYYDENLSLMKKIGTWGGELEIAACALMLQCQITLNDQNYGVGDINIKESITLYYVSTNDRTYNHFEFKVDLSIIDYYKRIERTELYEPVQSKNNKRLITEQSTALKRMKVEHNISPPFFNKLEFDQNLQLDRPDFNLEFISQNLEFNSNTLSSVSEFPPPGIFAYLSLISYQTLSGDKAKHLNLPEGWQCLTTAYNKQYLNDYYGIAFWNARTHQVVIAHRGTVITSIGALWTDAYGIFMNQYSAQVRSAITFAHIIGIEVAKYNKHNHRSIQLFCTGHSLGGWHAQITTFSLRYLNVNDNKFVKLYDQEGYNSPAVVFDPPGARDILTKMQNDFDIRSSYHSISIDTLDITIYLSSPNMFNTISTHVGGHLYRIFLDLGDISNTFMFMQYNQHVHSMKKIYDVFDAKTGEIANQNNIEEVVDWPTQPIGRDELKKFFDWAKRINTFHPPHSSQFQHFVSVHAGYYPIRYQTIPFNPQQFSINALGQKGLQFLIANEAASKFTNILSIDKLLKDMDIPHDEHSEILRMLSCYTIHNNKIIIAQSVSPRKFFPYIIALITKFPALYNAIIGIFNTSSLKLKVYKTISDYYLNSNKIHEYAAKFNSEDTMEYTSFVKADAHQIWLLATDNTELTLSKLYAILQNEHTLHLIKEKYFIVSLSELLRLNNIINLQDAIQERCLLVIHLDNIKQEQALESSKILSIMIKNLSNSKFIIIYNKFQKYHLNKILNEIYIYSNKILHSTEDKILELSDLKKDVQRNLLENNIITLNNNAKISISSLIKTNDLSSTELDKLLDHKTLINFIYDQEIVLNRDSSVQSNFFDPDIIPDNDRIISVQCLVDNLANGLDESAIYMISDLGDKTQETTNRVLEERIINILGKSISGKITLFDRKHKDNANIVISSDNDYAKHTKNFNNLCSINNKKIVYWIYLSSQDTFILHKLYNPNAYINHQVSYPDKLVMHPKFRIKLLNPDAVFIFKDIEISDIRLLFEFSNSELDTLIKNIKAGSIKLQASTQEPQLPFVGSAYWFKQEIYQNKRSLILFKASGPISNLRPYIDVNYKNIEGPELIEKINLDKTVLLLDMPRIGYSTFLNQLSAIYEKNWVITVDLSKYKNAIQELTDHITKIEDAVQFLSHEYREDKNIFFIKQLLHYAIKYPRYSILLIFDKIDNIIDTQHKDKIISLLKFLKDRCKLILVTNNQGLSVLQDSLGVFDSSFIPLTWEKKVAFLRQKWVVYSKLFLSRGILDQSFRSTNLEPMSKFEKFSSVLLSSLSVQSYSVFPNDIIHMHLISNLFLGDFIRYAKYDIPLKNINLFDVYTQFFNQQTVSIQKVSMYTEYINIALKRLAFIELFDKFYNKIFYNINIPYANLNDIQQIYNPVSLAQLSYIDNANNKFLVPTFAEYYVSEIIVDYLHKPFHSFADKDQQSMSLLVIDILTMEKYDILRNFLNHRIMSKGEISNDVLKWHAEMMYKSFYSSQHRKHFFNKNWETMLHVAVYKEHLGIINFVLKILTYNDALYPMLFIRNVYDHTSLGLAINLYTNVKDEDRKISYEKIISSLLKYIINLSPNLKKQCIISTFFLSSNDNINEQKSLQQIMEINNINGEELLTLLEEINRNKELIPIFSQKMCDIKTTTSEKIRWLTRLNIDKIILHYLFASYDEYGESILYKIIKNCKTLYDNDNIIEEIVKLELDLSIRNKNGHTVLYTSAKNHKWDIVDYLIKNGAYFNESVNKDSILNLMAKDGEFELVLRLLEYGYLDTNSEEFYAFLFTAARDKEWETLVEIASSNYLLNETYRYMYGETLLHCVSEYHTLVKLLLEENNFYIGTTDNNGMNILHYVCRRRNKKSVKYLIKRNFDVNSVDNDNQTALHHATKVKKNNKVVKLLIEKGANVNAVDNEGRSVLHNAARFNDKEVMHYLIEKGANINAVDNEGRSVLHNAARFHDKEVMHYLIEKGVNINAVDNEGRSILHEVARFNDKEVLHYLIEKGANVNAVDNEGRSILHEAARFNDKEVMHYLIEKGANVNAIDFNSISILHYAARFTDKEVMHYLIEKGANVNAIDRFRCSVLHYAAYASHWDILKLLVDKGGDVNIKDQNGDTVMYYAAHAFQWDIFRLLIDKGGDINTLNRDQEPILHIIARSGNIKLLKYCIENYKADINIQDADGETIFLEAVSDNNWTLATNLLKSIPGIDINIQRFDGLTALHYAASVGYIDFINLLISHNANIRLKDRFGQTAADKAAASLHSDISLYLKSIENIQKESDANKLISLWSNLNTVSVSCDKPSLKRSANGDCVVEKFIHFLYEPLHDTAASKYNRMVNLYSHIALAAILTNKNNNLAMDHIDSIFSYNKNIGDILAGGVANHSIREKQLLARYYDEAQQFFKKNPEKTVLSPIEKSSIIDTIEHEALIFDNSLSSILVFRDGYQNYLYSQDINYKYKFLLDEYITADELLNLVRSFFKWRDDSDSYQIFTLIKSSVPPIITHLESSVLISPENNVQDTILSGRWYINLIEGVPNSITRELFTLNGTIIEASALNMNFFETNKDIITIRIEVLHEILPYLTIEQINELVKIIKDYNINIDRTYTNTLTGDSKYLINLYIDKVAHELQQPTPNINIKYLSELSWQSLEEGLVQQPNITPQMANEIIKNIQNTHGILSTKAVMNGLLTQTFFFLPDLIKAKNTGNWSNIINLVALMASDTIINKLYSMAESKFPAKAANLLRKLPITSPIFKILTIYNIISIHKELHNTHIGPEERGVIQHKLGEQYATLGLIIAEFMGAEVMPLWGILMAEQNYFDSVSFRKLHNLDIPLWDSWLMSLGFEQDRLKHIFQERVFINKSLSIIEHFNQQITQPYGWTIIKIATSLGPQQWRTIPESKIPNDILHNNAIDLIREKCKPPIYSIQNSPYRIKVTSNSDDSMACHITFEHYVQYMTPTYEMITLGEYQFYENQDNYFQYKMGHNLQWTREVIHINTTEQIKYHGQTYTKILSSNTMNYYTYLASYNKFLSKLGKIKLGTVSAALYRTDNSLNDTTSQRRMIIFFDPREGDFFVKINANGLRKIDTINKNYNNSFEENLPYYLTIYLGTKPYKDVFFASNKTHHTVHKFTLLDNSKRVHSIYLLTDIQQYLIEDSSDNTSIKFLNTESAVTNTINGNNTIIITQNYGYNSSLITLSCKKVLELYLEERYKIQHYTPCANIVNIWGLMGHESNYSKVILNQVSSSFNSTILGDIILTDHISSLKVLGKSNTTIGFLKQILHNQDFFTLYVGDMSPILHNISTYDAYKSSHARNTGQEKNFFLYNFSYIEKNCIYKWYSLSNNIMLSFYGTIAGNRAVISLRPHNTILKTLDSNIMINEIIHYREKEIDIQDAYIKSIFEYNIYNNSVTHYMGNSLNYNSKRFLLHSMVYEFQMLDKSIVFHAIPAHYSNITINGIVYSIIDKKKLCAIDGIKHLIDIEKLVSINSLNEKAELCFLSNIKGYKIFNDTINIHGITLYNIKSDTIITLKNATISGQGFLDRIYANKFIKNHHVEWPANSQHSHNIITSKRDIRVVNKYDIVSLESNTQEMYTHSTLEFDQENALLSSASSIGHTNIINSSVKGAITSIKKLISNVWSIAKSYISTHNDQHYNINTISEPITTILPIDSSRDSIKKYTEDCMMRMNAHCGVGSHINNGVYINTENTKNIYSDHILQRHITDIDVNSTLVLAQWLVGMFSNGRMNLHTTSNYISPEEAYQQRLLDEYEFIFKNGMTKFDDYIM